MPFGYGPWVKNVIRYRVDRYTFFLTSELAKRKRKMAPTFRGF